MSPDATRSRELWALLDSNPHQALREADTLPNDEANLGLKAALYVEAGNLLKDEAALEKGISLFRSMVEKNPNDFNARYNLANGLNNLSALKSASDFLSANDLRREAKKLYAEVGDSNEPTPLRTQAYTNYAHMLYASSRYVEALFAYKQAIAIYPRNGVAAVSITRLLVEFMRHRLGDANLLYAACVKYAEIARKNQDVIERFAGAQALNSARQVIEQFPYEEISVEEPKGDGYKGFVYRNDLALTLTIAYDILDYELWDSLTIASITRKIPEEKTEFEVPQIFAFFNSIKMEYLAARYTLYLATSQEHPERGYFYNTLDYAQYSVSASLLMSSYKALVDILDKIGLAALHYLNGHVPEPRSVNFYNAWFQDPKAKAVTWKDVIRLEVEAGNFALKALSELALDIWHPDAHLRMFKDRRNYLTHRFLILHDMGEHAEKNSDLVMHDRFDDFQNECLELAKVVKAAITYLVLAIKLREERLAPPDSMKGTMPIFGYRHIRRA